MLLLWLVCCIFISDLFAPFNTFFADIHIVLSSSLSKNFFAYSYDTILFISILFSLNRFFTLLLSFYLDKLVEILNNFFKFCIIGRLLYTFHQLYTC